MVARYSKSALLAVFLVACLAGCPSDEIGSTLTVAGKVTIDDKALDNGNVNFNPMESKGNKTKASVSGIVKNGEYTLSSGTTTATRTGAPAGWYKVTITTSAGMGPMGTGVAGDNKAIDPKPAGVIPKGQPIADKFTKVESTPFEVEVKSGGSYDLKATSK